MIDTKVIRNKILDLAVRGKLTKQLPEDGTAEELFQQIQAEKQALIKAGKIKKEKPLPKITEEEIPYTIPHNWQWICLGSIISIKSGEPLTAADAKSGAVPVYGGNGIFGFHNNSIVKKDTIVIGRVGYYCGSVHVTIKDAWVTDNAFITAYPEKYINKWYLVYTLRQMKLGQNNNGAAQPVVSGKKIYPLLFPLPPLAEQKRIVEKIEQAFSVLDTIDELQQKYADNMTVLKSKLIDLAIRGKLTEQLPEDGTAEELYQQIQAEKQNLIKTGKIKKEKPLPEINENEIPFKIPKNWMCIRLGDFGSWHAGATPSRGNNSYYNNGNIPWLKTGDLNDNYITDVSENITELALKECSVQLNPIGSVLIAMYGATIGKLGIAQIPLTTNQACCACVPYSRIYNRYLFFLLMSMRNTFIDMGIGGAQSNISREKIVNAIVPLPPLAEQKRIVERLDKLLAVCEQE